MKQLFVYLFTTAMVLGLAIACGPKTVPQQSDKATDKTKQQTPTPNQDVQLNADANIGSDAGKWGPDSVETRKQYSLYRENYKQKLYQDALPYWRYVYKNAPALRKTTYLNGANMYESLAKEAEDETTKQAYIDTLFMIYDQRQEHFGEAGVIDGWRAYKLKKYRPDEEAKYDELVKNSIEIQQEESDYFLLYPYLKQAISAFNALPAEKKKDEAEQGKVTEVYNMLTEATDYNISEEHKYADKYEATQLRMDKLHDKYVEIINKSKPTRTTVSFATCPEVKSYFDVKLAEKPGDVKVMKQYVGKLIKAKCKTDPKYIELNKQIYAINKTASRAKILAQHYYKNKDINTALQYLTEALDLEKDPTKQASIYMFLASLERRKVSDLTAAVATQARKYAKKAAELKPGWGKPYMFIGDLYASSGPLCGSGRGWNSQVVAWAAVDMWEKAKEIDPSVASDANESINRYRQYFPANAECFMRSVSSGQRYKIGCWIGTTTKARCL